MDQLLVIHYKVLLVLSYEWEMAIEDAAEALRADSIPLNFDLVDAKDALLSFVLYPASAHQALCSGEEIASTVTAIAPPVNSRVVLVACAPTYPSLDQTSVDDMVSQHLPPAFKRNGIRALEPDALKEQAEALMRLSLRQVGISPATISSDSRANDPQFSLARYEASRWI